MGTKIGGNFLGVDCESDDASRRGESDELSDEVEEKTGWKFPANGLASMLNVSDDGETLVVENELQIHVGEAVIVVVVVVVVILVIVVEGEVAIVK